MKFRPTKVWRRRTSFGPGAATSTSSQDSTSGPPGWCTRMALGMPVFTTPRQHVRPPCYKLVVGSLFLSACRGEATPRPPLWMMRQAGRYLPEHRQVRSGVSFLELCKNPQLAAEVTLQPIRRFGFDAAILFSDLLVPLEAMGLPVTFTDQGPTLPAPIRTPADLARLSTFDPAQRTPFVLETVRLARATLGET